MHAPGRRRSRDAPRGSAPHIAIRRGGWALSIAGSRDRRPRAFSRRRVVRTGTAVFRYIVVFDPDGGFVTGGGWINSPWGAFPAAPELTGKATFGFNAKYKKGQQVPSGETQFQFRVAGLNFHSTEYEWLVVAGPQAKYKGTGSINGSGAYGFMLTAIDGQRNGGGGVDRFRIKVWDKVTEAVVYDNQMGAPDDGGDATALGGGSIVIHSQ